MDKWIFVSGGAKSGKSDFVTDACESFKDVEWWGTATEQSTDLDWQERLASLKSNRNPGWLLFDGPWAWPGQASIGRESAGSPQVFVMDSLNLWLAAQIHRGMSLYTTSQLKVHLDMEFTQLLASLNDLKCSVVLISAEVGSGVVPSGEAGRLFRDLLSTWNRRIVKQSDFGVSMQTGQAFLWPAGRTPLPPEGTVLRCVDSSHIRRILAGV
ncbi:MAG: bifunctional adenosylcobinamide kinase/adenosylcobinamide-phosphate guanylyltransferase [Silvanigrellaceae bacterium]